MTKLAVATDALLSAEDIEEYVPAWSVIESDAQVAIEFRQSLKRRLRWAHEYDRLMQIFRRQLVGGYRQLVETLPESCFEGMAADDAPFTVPLVSLIDRPADMIERLLLCVYDDDVFRYELFLELRQRIGRNILIASGFPPDVDYSQVQQRLVMPTRHKSTNPAELTDLYLADTPFEEVLNLPIPFSVPDDARFEHCHIVGGTGHGKTQLMQRMIHADLVAAQGDGRSVVVIDSQGDLINKLVRLDLFSPNVSNSLSDRLVVIDPSDVEYPAALNLFDAHLERLEGYRPVDRERVLNGVVELYEGFFGALLGAELTQKQGVIFRYLARLMLNIPGATIHTLMQLMEDGRSFRPHMATLEGSARYFFEKEFFHPSFAATKKQILKRLWGVLSTPSFERMFAQKENKLDLFAAINDGKIILINTAKDLLKTEGSQLFGRFFISMLAQAALERSTIPEHRRTPTYVYVDEAQEYFDDTIETILGQARKYRLGITAAHQTLDQLSPRLRAAFLSNTSFKCVGGVSNKDARALASELHATTDFIEGMRRRRECTEFAVWLKHRTPEALRLSVPLGFLERQPTLTEEEYDLLIEVNRTRYCGTLAEVPTLDFSSEFEEEPPPLKGRRAAPPDTPRRVSEEQVSQARSAAPEPVLRTRRPVEQRELGKGGAKHRYLQSLVKELAEQQGFRATIEAPLAGRAGQVDVLLERNGETVAVEVSVTTPADYERQNVSKCLDAGYGRVVVVLAKTKANQARYQASITEGLSADERARVTFLAAEDIPDYLAALAPPPEDTETTVRGYKVRVSRATVSPEEAKNRRETLAKLVARSLDR